MGRGLEETPLKLCFVRPVRLVDGDDEGTGRVEVFYDGEWGTVCDDLWDSYDAEVVCRELDFEGGEALGMAYYGQGAGPIWLDSVECMGDEEGLFDCRHQPWGDHDCSHTEDASVRCRMYYPRHKRIYKRDMRNWL